MISCLARYACGRAFAVAALIAVCAAATGAPTPVPAAPGVNANAYLVVDHHSGHVLAEKAPDLMVEPASITKLMTAYVTFKKLAEGQVTLADEVTVSEKAWRVEGSRMWIEVGKRVRLEELLQGMIIQSGNDASIAIAEHIAGSEETFAALMNQYAAELGMSSSYFENSTGLPGERHRMSARDIVTLTGHLIREFPQYYSWYSEKSYTFNGIQQYNRNNLLWRDKSVDGVKTGHTEAAGYCLVSSAQRGDMRVIAVVLGTPGKEARVSASQSLINYAFNFYETHLLYSKGAAITTEKVWKGERDTVDLGLRNDLYVTIPRGQYDQLQASMNLPDTLIAPLGIDEPQGSVVVALGEETVAQLPLHSLEEVPSGNFFRRAVDELMLWFE